ncbi:MAG: ABC transporter permease subunit [Candidatus Thiodiazotropha sp.]
MMKSRYVIRVLLLIATVGWVVTAVHTGTDEFGRPTIVVLLSSMSFSLVRGLLLAVPVILFSAALVFASEIYGWRWHLGAVHYLFDAIESVPSYLWILAAVAASTQFPALAGNIALAIALMPLAYTTTHGVCSDIMRQPYIQAAILSGLPRHAIIRHHVIPHIVSPSLALFLNLLGTATAIYGSLGAFGFANRETLDLGTLLLRGREQALLDASLLWLTLGGYCLLYSFLLAGSRAILWRTEFSESPGTVGGIHLDLMPDRKR